MASIVIRNLDDQVKQELRIRAAQNGRSMEAEARAILAQGVQEPATAYPNTAIKPIRGRWKGRFQTDNIIKHTREI